MTITICNYQKRYCLQDNCFFIAIFDVIKIIQLNQKGDTNMKPKLPFIILYLFLVKEW